MLGEAISKFLIRTEALIRYGGVILTHNEVASKR